jgi:protein-S-isoprenylcysteine O-methyltransferase Ste14
VINVLRTLAWLACVVYSTIPAFWLAIHPYADYWRSRQRSPYKILVPLWIAMWAGVGAITWPWHRILLYDIAWTWLLAGVTFAVGLFIYSQSLRNFTGGQLGGLPEVVASHRKQHLVTSGIRNRVRHPVYLAHLCEMLAWSVGSGLAVNYVLTLFAVITGTIMIRMEDKELEGRFGEEFRAYRDSVPSILPKLRSGSAHLASNSSRPI